MDAIFFRVFSEELKSSSHFAELVDIEKGNTHNHSGYRKQPLTWRLITFVNIKIQCVRKN